ncbi:MAG: hypothetical protein VCC99_03820, partial [Alphaproteobacteria bacterium]
MAGEARAKVTAARKQENPNRRAGVVMVCIGVSLNLFGCRWWRRLSAAVLVTDSKFASVKPEKRP